MTADELFVRLLGQAGPPPAENVADYLALAEAVITGYLGVTSLPAHPQVVKAQALMALTLYNRRGAEGEASRREGEVHSSFEAMPLVVRLQLRPFRQARALGLTGDSPP